VFNSSVPCITNSQPPGATMRQVTVPSLRPGPRYLWSHIFHAANYGKNSYELTFNVTIVTIFLDALIPAALRY